ncbi:MAG: hypothetical protein IPI46_02550 [Bacteroidetes bacterium]|nr:hypothetical protein [Bacteroidota bacterium]
MKYSQKILCLFFIVISLMGCVEDTEIGKTNTQPTYLEIQKADWLLGEWQLVADGMITKESWSKGSDSSYSGFSYSMEGKDTVSTEHISLIEESGTLYYIPVVSNQNEGNPIQFKSTKVTVRELVFENLAHDFPTKISYTLLSDDSLIAEISGMMEGKLVKRQFSMYKLR